MKKLILLGLFALLGIFNARAYDFGRDGIYYNISGTGEVSVTYWGTSYNAYSGSVVIPATVQTYLMVYRVTSIGDQAFSGCSSLTSVTIPSSVTSIGDQAFSGCSSLTSVTIPSSVTSIGDQAFSGCSSLTSVTIPSSVTSIGDQAFSGCSSLTSVTIPSSVTSIGSWAFSSCSGLTSVTIPNSVTAIGDSAFSDCRGLTSVIIGERIDSIGKGAFVGCGNLESVEWHAKHCQDFKWYGSYGGSPFKGDTSLTSITFGDKVEYIPAYLCYGCSGLTSVTIPNSVTSIGARAFEYSGLTSVTIPNSVTSIGEYALSNCSKLESVEWNARHCSDNRTSPFYNNTALTSITFGDKVEYIPAYLCRGCGGLTSVTIPESVTSIGWYAFEYSGLTSVTIGERVDSIGACAFRGCNLESVEWNAKHCQDFEGSGGSSVYPRSASPFQSIRLTSITFGDKVEHIPGSLCLYCRNLTSVTIPEGVISIGSCAFADCRDLTSVVWNARRCEDLDDRWFLNSPITSIVFGDEVEHIPAYLLCNGCSGLTSVTIPESVTSIGKYALSYCSKLESVEWNAKHCHCQDFELTHDSYGREKGSTPLFNRVSLTAITFGDKVEHIPAYLCYGCSGLTSVTIPESVTSIGDGAFENCSGLTSVVIPESVTSIGWGAFSGTSISSPLYNSKVFAYMPNDYNGEYTIPDGIQSVAGRAFCGCSGLTSVTIPNSVTSIGACAFENCSGLASVTIPNSVTSIGACAFENCSGLTSVTIPNSVTAIGDSAFSDCRGLTSVIIGERIDSIGKGAFVGCGNLESVEWNAKHCQDFELTYDSYGREKGSTSPFEGVTSLTAITFGDKVEHIPAYLCYGCSGLTSVTIGNSVTSMGACAFENCSGLTSVTIPNSVTSIGARAFYGCNLESVEWNAKHCQDFKWYGSYYVSYGGSTSPFEGVTSLTTITFGDKVEHIPAYLCYGCSGLTSVTIPESVASIGRGAFMACGGLTSVTLPNGVTSIEDSIFSGCSRLMSVTLGEGVTSIGNGAFYNCRDLTSVTLGKGVTSIGNGAFYNCRDLTSITLPASMTSIGDRAFYYCYGLTSITSLAENPPVCGDDVFDKSGTLYVPRGCKAAYKAAPVWGNWWINDGTYTVTVEVNDGNMGRVEGGGVYDSGAQVTLTAIPNPGYRFKNWDYYETANPRTITVTYDITVKAVFERDPNRPPTDPTANEEALSAAPFAYVQGRMVYLSDNLGEVEAFTATGQRVYRGFDRSIAIPQPGVYILRVMADGRRCKVAVR